VGVFSCYLKGGREGGRKRPKKNVRIERERKTERRKGGREGWREGGRVLTFIASSATFSLLISMVSMPAKAVTPKKTNHSLPLILTRALPRRGRE